MYSRPLVPREWSCRRQLQRRDCDHLVPGACIGVDALLPCLQRSRRAHPKHRFRRALHRGDVDTVAEKLVAELQAAKPVHVCFSFKVGDTPHKAAMRSMELMMTEVKPRVEKALAR